MNDPIFLVPLATISVTGSLIISELVILSDWISPLTYLTSCVTLDVPSIPGVIVWL